MNAQFGRPYPMISMMSGTLEGFKRQWSTRFRRWSKKFRRRLFSIINAPYSWLFWFSNSEVGSDWSERIWGRQPIGIDLKTDLMSMQAWAIWGKLKTFLDIKKWFHNCITNFSSLLTSFQLSKYISWKYRVHEIRVNFENMPVNSLIWLNILSRIHRNSCWLKIWRYYYVILSRNGIR